jgi:hypothetical protein
MKLWMAVLLVCLVSTSQKSDAAIGTVTETTNAIPNIQRKKETLSGQKGTKVEMNDAVRTTQGKVGITFADDTKVLVNENSRLVIDDFVYDPATTKGGKLAVNVAHGTVRYASGQIAKNNPQSVSVNTPVATIGVRGTDFTATVDEFGRSTIILLPSCPFGWRDIERDCKTGEISVTTDVGFIIMNKPFQATKVDSRDFKPKPPVILKLTEDQISNMLIVNPPKELQDDKNVKGSLKLGALDVDFLKAEGLNNAIDIAQAEIFKDKLSQNLLEQDFLVNLLDVVNAQISAQTANLLKPISGAPKLLPDYISTSGVTVTLDEPIVTLCRDDGNRQCVTTPTRQNSVITQIQGSVEIRNRVNSGGNTIINIVQK